MATANKIIETVDKLKANAYQPEEKFRWISDLDGLVKRLVMQELESVGYVYPDDLDTELLIPAPFEATYELYLMAMIDLHNKEYGEYNNNLLAFNTRFDEYRQAYIREHMPKSSGTYRNVMG